MENNTTQEKRTYIVNLEWKVTQSIEVEATSESKAKDAALDICADCDDEDEWGWELKDSDVEAVE